MENELDEHRLSHSGCFTRLRFCLKSQREDKPADSKHCQSHGGSLLLVRPIIQVRVEHSLPDNGRIPGGARLHVTSRPGIKEGGTSDRKHAQQLHHTTSDLSVAAAESSGRFCHQPCLHVNQSRQVNPEHNLHLAYAENLLHSVSVQTHPLK